MEWPYLSHPGTYVHTIGKPQQEQIPLGAFRSFSAYFRKDYIVGSSFKRVPIKAVCQWSRFVVNTMQIVTTSIHSFRYGNVFSHVCLSTEGFPMQSLIMMPFVSQRSHGSPFPYGHLPLYHIWIPFSPHRLVQICSLRTPPPIHTYVALESERLLFN